MIFSKSAFQISLVNYLKAFTFYFRETRSQSTIYIHIANSFYDDLEKDVAFPKNFLRKADEEI